MWDVELAKMMIERNNKPPNSPIIGNVVSVVPLKISILKGSIILDKDNLYICSRLYENTNEYEANGDMHINDIVTSNNGEHSHHHNVNINKKYNSSGTIKLLNKIKINEKVLLIPSGNNQIYFILDKVKKVGE